MTRTLRRPALVGVCVLSMCGAVLAKGSSGHGSGGHGSGGHGSSGHGHAGVGHSSAGHGHSRSHGSGRSSNRRTEGRVVGKAVPRTTPVSTHRRVETMRVLPRSSGLGLGYAGLGYDPFLYGYGFGYSSYGTPAYSGFTYAPDPFDRLGPTGSVRLEVTPRTSTVHVDGYYAGIVDDFDGYFQRLEITAGPHHIEISEPGYEPLTIDVVIQAHRKVTFRGVLTK